MAGAVLYLLDKFPLSSNLSGAVYQKESFMRMFWKNMNHREGKP